MPDELQLRVRRIIADRILRDPDTLKETDNLIADLGADSLDLAEIVMDFEDVFRLTFRSLDDVQLKTVADCEAAVKKALNKGGANA